MDRLTGPLLVVSIANAFVAVAMTGWHLGRARGTVDARRLELDELDPQNEHRRN